jgi:hypothetical protein
MTGSRFSELRREHVNSVHALPAAKIAYPCERMFERVLKDQERFNFWDPSKETFASAAGGGVNVFTCSRLSRLALKNVPQQANNSEGAQAP